MNRSWAAPLAFFYGIGITVRHKMFDWGLLPTQKYDIPIICVGNLTVGGTGKTPFTEMLINSLHKQWRVAVLSRGYGRRTKGYLEVEVNSPFLEVGDEPKQIKQKFPDITVAVCEKRTIGIAEIRENHPDINLIILDDGFQHRYVEPWVNIVLMDYNRPVYRDHLIPWGNLRDTKNQLHRANFVVVTKCPPDITAIDRRIVQKSIGLYPYQNLYFSNLENGPVTPIFENSEKSEIENGANVIAMSGIGSPQSFSKELSNYYNIVDELIYPDHYAYRRRDLETMEKLLNGSPDGTVIITTEKDAVKFRNSKKIPDYLKLKLFYLPIKISFKEDSSRDFLNKLDYDIRTNPKDRILRS